MVASPVRVDAHIHCSRGPKPQHHPPIGGDPSLLTGGTLSNMDWRAIAVLVHVLAAFWYVAGYVGTNVCTEVARRTSSDEELRLALVLSSRFDRWMNALGGTAVGVSGLLTLWLIGTPILTPWVIGSIGLFAL